MRIADCRTFWSLAMVTLICTAGHVSVLAGGCAVSDGSELPSEDGCMLAFMYNQTGNHRLVVIDEKNRRRYEAPLDNAGMAPFWEGGKVYVVGVSGSVQGFAVGKEKLVPEKAEAISEEVVREVAYSRSQHRLYLIQTGFDDHRKIFYELSVIDFPARKTLWTKRIDDTGLLTIMDRYVCVTGLRLVEVFGCDTGEKIGTTTVAKLATSADARAHE
ncbi:MAG TPA: hypothetical protein VL171_05820 [Verrucomicrobiae bacterium]|nr:hypothetical protein [Verrucomicrobiae bacterium]